MKLLTDFQLLAIKVIIGILLLLGLYFWGHHRGVKVERAEWEKKEVEYKDAEIKLRQDHAKKLSDTIEANHQLNKVNEYEHQISLEKVSADLAAVRLDANRRGGLRIAASACNTVGTDAPAQSTGQRDESTTGTIALPERTQEGLWSIVKQADDVTEQLRACQQWIRDGKMY